MGHVTRLARAYATHTGSTPKAVCRRFFNDGRLWGFLESGERSITLRWHDKALKIFAANWPADLRWPDHIPHPEIEKELADGRTG